MCCSIVAVKSYITHARGADFGAMTLGTITQSLTTLSIIENPKADFCYFGFYTL
jgi:hypothetical protein